MKRPMRIISLAPTQTEIIAALGRLDALIGVTENCDYPEEVIDLPTFGTWYAPDLLNVIQEKPDLVCTFGKHQEEIGNSIREAGIPVYQSDHDSLQAAMASMLEMGEMMDAREEAAALIGEMTERLSKVPQLFEGIPREKRPSVFRIMNWHPLITVGPGSFQHDAIEMAGGRNVMGDGTAPYFSCLPEVVRQRDPDYIFYCEPHIKTLLREDPDWKRTKAVREDHLLIFDCGLTCRSGPRIVDMVEQLARAIHG